MPIGALWYAPFPNQGETFGRFIEKAAKTTDVQTPVRGRYRVGSIDLEVLGPVRRYASLNDQSLVIVASLGGARVLLSGDIERIAQREITAPRVDVLKVPHQGAATSDPAWLVTTGAVDGGSECRSQPVRASVERSAEPVFRKQVWRCGVPISRGTL